MLVRKLEPFPVECVVRGYIAGSAWKEYRESGTLAGEPLPPGLRESERLDPPIFSPATKAETGARREHHLRADGARSVGDETMRRALRERASRCTSAGARSPAARGIIIADTKFEFGRDDRRRDPGDGRDAHARLLALLAGGPVRAGRGQPSLDKQPLRDYLEELVARASGTAAARRPTSRRSRWRRRRERYQDAFRRLTGSRSDEVPLARWGR
jgi:phosphoribosylaminoimidazole-succinocarboxamide synthase